MFKRFLPILLLFAFNASAATSIVQSKSASATTGTSVSATFNSTNTAGNFLICGISSNLNQTVTISDSQGNTWSTAIAQARPDGAHSLAVWYSNGIIGGTADIVTASSAGSTFHSIACQEWTGIVSGNPLDGTGAVGHGTSTAPASGSYLVTATDGVFAFGVGAGSTWTTGTGWQSNTTNSNFTGQEYQIASGTTVNATFTQSSSGTWTVMSIPFKSAAAANCVGVKPTFNFSTATSASSDNLGHAVANLSAPLTLPPGNANQFSVVLAVRSSGVNFSSPLNGQFTLSNPSDNGTSTFHWQIPPVTQAGTITASTTSATVTGAGTSFSSAIIGQALDIVGTGVVGTVLSVQSATSLTLAANSGVNATASTWSLFPPAFNTPITVTANNGLYDVYYTLTQDTVSTGQTNVVFHWTTHERSSTDLLWASSAFAGSGSTAENASLADQSTGTTTHVASITNLTPNQTAKQGYYFVIADSCFTAGVPDVNFRAFSPNFGTPGISGDNSWLNSPPPAVIPGVQYFFTTTQLNKNLGQDQSGLNVQDGVHPGQRGFPGFGLIMTMGAFLTARGNSGTLFSSLKPVFTLTSTSQLLSTYVNGGVFANYTIRSTFSGPPPATGFSGNNTNGPLFSQNAVDLNISSNAPTGGTPCTTAGGTINTIIGGCSYPITVTVTCSSVGNTCPTQSYIDWITLMPITTSTGLAGPSVGCIKDATGTCAVPCIHQASAAANGCIFHESPPAAINGKVLSWDGFYFGTSTNPTAAFGLGINSWGDYYGESTWRTNGTNIGTQFYNGDNTYYLLSTYCANQGVCNGHSASLFLSYAYNVAHNQLDHQILPPAQSGTPILTFTQGSTAVVNIPNPCNYAYGPLGGVGGNAPTVCGEAQVTPKAGSITTGSIAALATGLAAGKNYYAYSGAQGFLANSDIGWVISADPVGGTITLETYDPPDMPPNSTWNVYQIIAGITADAGSNTNKIISAATDMNGSGTADARIAFFVNNRTISTISRSSNVITVTIPSGFTDTGSGYICIEGVTFDSTMNGCTSSYTGHGTTTLTFANTGTNGSCSGSCGGFVENMIHGNMNCYAVKQISTTYQGIPFYVATGPGSGISSIDPGTGTINLSTGIAGFTGGSKFECRSFQTPVDIYFWTEFQYNNLWLNFQDYMTADATMGLSRTEQVMPAVSPFNQRELGEMLETCRHVIDILATPGITLSQFAIQPATDCTNPTYRSTYLDMELAQIDNIADNIFGNGLDSDNFLEGVGTFALLRWASDQNLSGTTGDPRLAYFLQQICQFLYNQYNYSGGINWNKNSLWAPAYHQVPFDAAPAFFGLFFGNSSYVLDSTISPGVTVHPQTAWQEQSLLWPLFAYMYKFTGNGVIPNSGGVTYGAAFTDMERYGNVYGWNGSEGVAGAYLGKTVGEFSLWQLDALNYALGSKGTGPVIVSPPTSVSVLVGSNATFNVTATGSGLTYQWFENNVAIPGATSASLTQGPQSLGDSGDIYFVTVSNTAGSVTSSNAVLTVNSGAVAPTFVLNPASQTISAGTAATFSVATTGTQPVTYQWYENGILIPGATQDPYTTPIQTLADNNDTYSVIATNSAGMATSTTATLTVTSSGGIVPTVFPPTAETALDALIQ